MTGPQNGGGPEGFYFRWLPSAPWGRMAFLEGPGIHRLGD